MVFTAATDARKKWSSLCDNVARVRPSVIKRTHDYFFLSSIDDMLSVLSGIKYPVIIYEEEDGSYTAVADNLSLAENDQNKEAVLNTLANSILDYSREYYENYRLYSTSPNRKAHLSYVTKAFLLDDAKKIRGEMLCRSGKN